MEEVDGILTYTLKTIGCEITSKICELSSPQLIHCVLKCLSLIHPDDASVPSYSPSMAMSNRFKIAQQIAQILTDLGYQDEIECQSLLYPTEVDTRKILIFCVEKLPREGEFSDQISSLQEKFAVGSKAKEDSPEDSDFSSQFGGNGVEVDGIRLPSAVDINNLPKETLKFYASHLAELNFEKLRESYRKPAREVTSPVEEVIPPKPVLDVDDDDDFGDPDLPVEEIREEPVVQMKPEIAAKPKMKPVIAQKPVARLSENDKAVDEAAERLKELQEDNKSKEAVLLAKQRENLELARSIKGLQNSIKNLKASLPDKQKELDKAEKMAALLGGSDSALEKLKTGVDAQVEKLLKLAAQWEVHRKPLVDQIREKQAGGTGGIGGGGDREEIKILKSQLKEMGQEAKMKEQICAKLTQEYEKMSKDLNRSSYTRRITEIIGNIKKQKREIKKVLQDTKTIQKDINTLTGRLDRTFAVADELIFKDAEKDKNVAQSYKLLVAIHSDFSKIINTLEEAGNLRRQSRDLEDKLEIEKGKSVEDKLKRLKADISQMQKENRILEARLRDPTLERNRKQQI